jgi:hypothetical protein
MYIHRNLKLESLLITVLSYSHIATAYCMYEKQCAYIYFFRIRKLG